MSHGLFVHSGHFRTKKHATKVLRVTGTVAEGAAWIFFGHPAKAVVRTKLLPDTLGPRIGPCPSRPFLKTAGSRRNDALQPLPVLSSDQQAWV